MKRTHLTAALLAFLLFASLLFIGAAYAEAQENRYVYALASVEFDQKFLGSALQCAAFRQVDLLPVYGSSELFLQKPYQDPYRAINIFRGKPTGFMVFPVAYGDTTTLLMLQRLAAIEPTLRGKKVVISLSPTWFFERLQEPKRAYAGNFSRLHAGALLFNTQLSYQLKQDIARRMLEYPDTLAHDALLQFAAEHLASDTLTSRVLYELALPLGKLQNLVLRLQDHWEMLTYIWSHSAIPLDPSQRAASPDWPSLIRRAESETQLHTNNNPLHFDNHDWERGLKWHVIAQRRDMSDEKFRRGMERAREWVDLELLLRTLQELGAKPLVLSMPIGGKYYDFLGVSPASRALYYQHLRDLAANYGAAVRDFADHDQDPFFVLNARGHLMPKGWVYYNQALDDFYHDRPLR